MCFKKKNQTRQKKTGRHGYPRINLLEGHSNALLGLGVLRGFLGG